MDDEKFMEAMDRLVEAARNVANAIIEAFRDLAKAVGACLRNFINQLYCTVATPREYHLMMHSNKRRVRKKWRGILHRRLMTALRKGGTA